jgi:hypothetical protein
MTTFFIPFTWLSLKGKSTGIEDRAVGRGGDEERVDNSHFKGW